MNTNHETSRTPRSILTLNRNMAFSDRNHLLRAPRTRDQARDANQFSAKPPGGSP